MQVARDVQNKRASVIRGATRVKRKSGQMISSARNYHQYKDDRPVGPDGAPNRAYISLPRFVRARTVATD